MNGLDDWDIALFDAGRTLIRQHPGLAETILAWSEHAGAGLEPEAAERAAEASQAFAESRNLGPPPGEARLDHEAFLVAFYGAGLRAARPDMGEAEGARRARELYEFSEEVRHWIAIPGARESLELLRHRRRRAGLVSNFSLALRDILASQGLLALLDPVVVSAEVGVEKPDPEILRIACSRAGVAPSRAVYVGDHPLDVLCASRAGMRSIWVTDPGRAMPASLGVQPEGRASTIALVPALLGLS